jgi:hypothetical protein
MKPANFTAPKKPGRFAMLSGQMNFAGGVKHVHGPDRSIEFRDASFGRRAEAIAEGGRLRARPEPKPVEI